MNDHVNRLPDGVGFVVLSFVRRTDTPYAVLREGGLFLAAILVTAVAARAEIPWYPVPFTLQTLAVTMCGLLLGAKRGFVAQLGYLGAGAIGLPVLSGGGAGAHHFVGPTAGYLWSFPLVAGLIGLLCQRPAWRTPSVLVLVLVAAHTINLAMGGYWLDRLEPGIGWSVGVAPFILGGLFKSLVAAVAVPEIDRRAKV